MQEHRTPLDVRVEQMLTEARVLIPGAQALFGFQLAVMLTDAFGELAVSAKVVHLTALCCIVLAMILLMAPAARQPAEQVVSRIPKQSFSKRFRTSTSSSSTFTQAIRTSSLPCGGSERWSR